MVDRLAENGAVQYGQDRWSFENNDSRLAGAGHIANEIRRLVEEGKYTDYVSGLSVKGRLINRMIDVVYWPRKLFSNNELGAWYDPSDVNVNWRRNLLTYTEQFDNGVWSKSETTVTANTTTAPDGTTTADKLVESANTARHIISTSSFTFVAGTVYTFTIRVKAAERQYIQISGSAAATLSYANFDISSGTRTAGTTNFGTIAQDTNGFYLITVQFSGVGGSGNLSVDILTNSTASRGGGSYAGDGTSGIYLWGAQLEVGTSPTSYQRIVTPEITYVADVQPQPILYQDAAGTTPVTAVEQPVGLMLDKSANLAIGEELVTNGDFSDGTNNWTAYNAASSISVSSGEMLCTVSTLGGVTAGGSEQLLSLTIGKWYKVTGTIRRVSGDSVNLAIANNAKTTVLASSVSVTSTANTEVSLTFLATETNSRVYLRCFSAAASGSSGYFDNISVKEIAGNHAYTPSSASTSRPTLSARYNLLTYSEQFDNAAWVKTNATVTANATIAPDGTTTADRITAANNTLVRVINSQLLTVNTPYNLKVKLKADTSNYAWITVRNGGTTTAYYGVVVDLLIGAVTQSYNGAGATLTSSSVTSKGNGWYELELVGSLSAITGNSDTIVGITDAATGNTVGSYGNVTASAAISTSIYAWGADLRVSNDGVGIPDYQRVGNGSAGSTDYDTVGFLPYLQFDGTDDFMVTNSIDFSTVTSDGQTRRNLLTYPSAFDNSAWTKTNATVTANTETAPDGTSTADKLVENTANSLHVIYQDRPLTISNTYTQTYYVKPAGRTKIQLRRGSSAGFPTPPTALIFDLTTGTYSGSLASGWTNPTITAVNDGWFKISITATAFASASDAIALYLCDSSGALTYTGDGTSGIYVWGAQLEEGSSATDFQDIGTDKVTVFAGVRKLSDAALGIPFEFGVGASNAFKILAPPGVGSASYRFDCTASLVASPSNYASPITNVLTGVGDTPVDKAILRINGTQVASSTTDQGGITFGNYPLYLGRRGGTTFPFNGRLYGLVIRGTQSTNAEITNTETWMNNKTGAY